MCVCPIVPLLLLFFSLSCFAFVKVCPIHRFVLAPPPQKKEEKGNNKIKGWKKTHQMLPKRETKKNDDDDEDIFSKNTKAILSRHYLRDFEERQKQPSLNL